MKQVTQTFNIIEENVKVYLPSFEIGFFNFLSKLPPPKWIGVNKNGPVSSFILSINLGLKCGCKSLREKTEQIGMSVRFAGGTTNPESNTSGTGDPSHCAERLWSWTDNSFCSIELKQINDYNCRWTKKLVPLLVVNFIIVVWTLFIKNFLF